MLGIELLGLAQLVDALVVAVLQHERATALVVRNRIVGVELQHLVGDLRGLGPAAGGNQRLGVQREALGVGEVRVVVDLRRVDRLARAAGEDQEVDLFFEHVEVVVRLVRVGAYAFSAASYSPAFLSSRASAISVRLACFASFFFVVLTMSAPPLHAVSGASPTASAPASAILPRPAPMPVSVANRASEGHLDAAE